VSSSRRAPRHGWRGRAYRGLRGHARDGKHAVPGVATGTPIYPGPHIPARALSGADAR